MTKEQFIGNPSHWDSHRPLLWHALEATKGQVVEFGIGQGSTPYLSLYCQDRKRELISYESSPEYYNDFKDLYPHQINLVNLGNWDHVFVRPDVLLIDHAPGERRHTDVYRFAEIAKIIVIHDTEPGSDHGYQMSKIWKYFKYRKDDDRINTWATAVSNFIDVSKWDL